MKFFRTFIFLIGLGILFLAMYFIHGESNLTKGEIFIWTSIVVMYFMVFGPFTFFSVLPKTESFDKMISVYTASWLAVTSYCTGSVLLILVMGSREFILRPVMNLPENWLEMASRAAETSPILQKALAYHELIFNIVIILQLVLFFVFLIKIYLGCVVSHQVEKVGATQKQEFAFIDDLRMETQLLAQECGMNPMISANIRARLSSLKEDVRYLSPVNDSVGHDYEKQMVDAVKSLRSLCIHQKDRSDEMAQILDKFKLLLGARRLILKK